MSSSSRLGLARFTLLGVMAWLAGCNFHFRDGISQEPLQLNTSEAGCLNNASRTIDGYFDGQASEQQIRSLGQCLSKSLKLFAERTRGATPGLYSPDELRSFLQKYFIQSFQISDSLLAEVMELKSAMLGGKADALTVDELSKMRTLVDILTEQSLKLKPYIPLSPEWAKTQSPERLDEATTALVAAATALAEPLQKSKTLHPYYLSRLGALRKEIEEATGQRSHGGLLRALRERMPLVQAIKGILISPASDRIEGDEWMTLWTTSAKWYGLWLQAAHLNANYATWQKGDGLERFARIAQAALDVLDETTQRHPNETISFAHVDRLLDSLQGDELPFLKGATAQDTARVQGILKKFLRPLFQKYLAGSDFGEQGRKAGGLSRAAIDRVRYHFQYWSDTQLYLDELYKSLARHEGKGGPEIPRFSSSELERFTLKDLFPPHAISELLSGIYEDFKPVIRKPQPIYFNETLQVMFPPGTLAQKPKMSFHHLSQSNWLQRIARITIAGYATDLARAKAGTGITQAETQALFDDLKAIGFEKRQFDPARDNNKLVKLRFQESNLFTYNANGDSLMERDEMAQLLAFLISAQSRCDHIHADIVQQWKDRKTLCANPAPSTPVLDVYGYPLVDSDCYRQIYFHPGNLKRYWEGLPALHAYFNGLGDDQRAEFRRNLELAGRVDAGEKLAKLGSLEKFEKLPFGGGDTSGMSGVLQYVEAVIAQYDVNRSGTIDFAESRRAFPIFREALKKIVKEKGQEDHVPDKYLEALFAYLMAHAKVPAGIDWYFWRMKSSWTFEASRLTLLKIFAELSGGAPSKK